MLKMFVRFFRKKRMKTLVLRPQGTHYNLKEIYHRINAEYFDNSLDLGITWQGNRNCRPRRSIRLGSYHPHKQMIKIHRILDRPDVPDYFVASIVYHEMLHHVLPPLHFVNRRRRVHHRAFLEKEKEFKEYQLAQEFGVLLKKQIFNTNKLVFNRRKEKISTFKN